MGWLQILGESMAAADTLLKQLYLPENCMELIEIQAVNVLGPDPADAVHEEISGTGHSTPIRNACEPPRSPR
jgi:hypothetical protein